MRLFREMILQIYDMESTTDTQRLISKTVGNFIKMVITHAY